MKNQVIRVNELAKIIGISRATVWRRLKNDPNFPRLIKLGSSKTSAVGVLSSEVEQWFAQQVMERNVGKKSEDK